MAKKHLNIFLFIFYFVIISSPQDSISQSQFQLLIGDTLNSEEARSIIQTTDGGFIAVGETGINSNMYIVKLNSYGQLLWNKTIGGNGRYTALSVVQTSEGGYAVSGFGSSFGSGLTGPFIVKLNQTGKVEWSKVIVDGFGDAAYSIIQTMDGGYAVATSPAEGGNMYRMVIVKLNNMGVIQWSKNVVGQSYARSIKQTSDGGYVIAGATRTFGAGSFDIFIVKLDSNGSLQWAKTLGSTEPEFAYSIVQTNDGGYAVAGRTASQTNGDEMYIVKLSSSGMLEWTKVFSIHLDRAYSIVQTIDGGYAVAGYTGGGAGMLILKLSSNGYLQWSRVVNGGPGQTYAYTITQTNDGGYAAAGFIGNLGAIGMYIVKFDNNGYTCGNTVTYNVSVDSGGILGSPVPSVINTTLIDTFLTFPTGTHGFVTPICVIGIQPISNEIPDSYKLYQNYPNPFNPTTSIRYEIPKNAEITIKIYDLLGKEVFSLNEYKQAGSYELKFDGSNLASGVYFYKIITVDFTDTKKMLIVK